MSYMFIMSVCTLKIRRIFAGQNSICRLTHIDVHFKSPPYEYSTSGGTSLEITQKYITIKGEGMHYAKFYKQFKIYKQFNGW